MSNKDYLKDNGLNLSEEEIIKLALIFEIDNNIIPYIETSDYK